MLVKLAAIFFSMILVNNYVLVKFYGICPFLGVSKKLDSSVGMGAAGIAVMVIATRSEERRVGKECRSRWSPYH